MSKARTTVISKLCDRKFPDTDGLQSEIIKRGGRLLVKGFYTIVRQAWQNLDVYTDWKDAQLVTIFKKGDRKLGMSLLFIPVKGFAGILLNRLSTVAEDFLLESQRSFCANRGTTGIIFSLRHYKKIALNQIYPSTYLSISQKPSTL